MNMDIKIVRPKKEDVDQIHHLFIKTVKNNFQQEEILDSSGDLIEGVIEDLLKVLKQDLDNDGENEYHLIAKANDEIIGTIACGKPNQIILENIKLDLSKTPEIKSVYILPKFQGKRIGRLLFNNILTHLDKNGVKAFCLDSGYHNAQKFWKRKLGDPICTLPEYWTPNHHHMIWYSEIEKLI